MNTINDVKLSLEIQYSEYKEDIDLILESVIKHFQIKESFEVSKRILECAKKTGLGLNKIVINNLITIYQQGKNELKNE